MNQLIRYECGCENVVEVHGTLMCVKKCDGHKAMMTNEKTNSREYYESMYCIQDGIPQSARYIKEFKESFAMLDWDTIGFILSGDDSSKALEIGCGTGCYVPMFLSGGWDYLGVETSEWAAKFTRSTFDVPVLNKDYMECDFGSVFSVILAAHTVEHSRDAPCMLKKIYGDLVDCGVLFLIIPDDTDPLNPDHWWFFNEGNLRDTLERIGFQDISIRSRRIISRERFIYCTARR